MDFLQRLFSIGLLGEPRLVLGYTAVCDSWMFRFLGSRGTLSQARRGRPGQRWLAPPRGRNGTAGAGGDRQGLRGPPQCCGGRAMLSSGRLTSTQ